MSKILIIDDDVENTKLLRFELEDEGYQVLAAQTVKEGVAAALTEQPDVILLDISLPDGDGIEACKILKFDSNSEHIPIIMVSAHGDEAKIIEALNSGAQDYISKPFDYRIVSARVAAASRSHELYKRMLTINEELARAMKAAEAASESKSNFLAAVSHEIRTPMNGVLGVAGLLSETDLSAEQQEFVNTILRSGRAQLDLINDILDFSKIQSGNLDIELSDFSIRQLIAETAEVVADQAHAKGLELNYILAPELPEKMSGDASRIRQVLQNLLSNAIKFTDVGDICIKTEWTAKSNNKGFLKLNVIDTGIGIPVDNQTDLFESFTQADFSATRKYGGVGLGLAICHELTHLMGGSISFTSELGCGSDFWIEIPIEALEAPQTGTLQFPGMCVLLIDDHKTCHESIAAHLANADIELMYCAHPNQIAGLKKIPHAILLDDNIPHLDTGTILKTLRTTPALQSLPIVLLESLAHSYHESIKNLTPWRLTKPVRREDLLALLQRVFTNAIDDQSINDYRIVHDYSAHKLRALIADDTAVNQKVAATILKRMGIKSDIASNGIEAVLATNNFPYDLILMDLRMPEMDGFEAAKRIRSFELNTQRHTPIIALSGYVEQETERKCLSEGLDALIAKPLEPNALATIIDKLVLKTEDASPNATLEQISAQDPSTIFDKAQICKRIGYDQAILQELVSSYLDATPRVMEKIREANANADWSALGKLAADLRETSHSLGAIAVAHAASAIENACKNTSEIAPANELLASLESEFARLSDYFDNH